MRKNFVLFFALVCFGMPFATQAQGIKAIRINEVLVYNDSGYQDNYGVNSGWFEVYNSGVRTLSLGGCYLTNDPNNPKKYRIPKNAQNVTLPPKGYALFFAYNEPTRGAFYVNFNLFDTGFIGNGRAFIALYDQSGKELIDSVSYLVSAQKPNCSFGKAEEEENGGEWRVLENATPMTLNHISSDRSRSEIYGEKDPHGFIITVTSVSVVFILLFVIALVFTCTGNYFKRKESKETNNTKPIPAATEKSELQADNTDGDIPAVIAAALYLYQQDCHEVEETGFYLNREPNQSSPWANKSLNFKRTPNRK